MTHAAVRSRRFRAAALVLALMGVGACHDDVVAPATVPTPGGPMADLGTYIVHVDVARRTVSVEAREPDAKTPAGVNALFYGRADQIEHAFTFVPPTDMGAGEAMFL